MARKHRTADPATPRSTSLWNSLTPEERDLRLKRLRAANEQRARNARIARARAIAEDYVANHGIGRTAETADTANQHTGGAGQDYDALQKAYARDAGPARTHRPRRTTAAQQERRERLAALGTEPREQGPRVVADLSPNASGTTSWPKDTPVGQVVDPYANRRRKLDLAALVAPFSTTFDLSPDSTGELIASSDLTIAEAAHRTRPLPVDKDFEKAPPIVRLRMVLERLEARARSMDITVVRARRPLWAAFRTDMKALLEQLVAITGEILVTGTPLPDSTDLKGRVEFIADRIGERLALPAKDWTSAYLGSSMTTLRETLLAIERLHAPAPPAALSPSTPYHSLLPDLRQSLADIEINIEAFGRLDRATMTRAWPHFSLEMGSLLERLGKAVEEIIARDVYVRRLVPSNVDLETRVRGLKAALLSGMARGPHKWADRDLLVAGFRQLRRDLGGTEDVTPPPKPSLAEVVKDETAKTIRDLCLPLHGTIRRDDRWEEFVEQERKLDPHRRAGDPLSRKDILEIVDKAVGIILDRVLSVHALQKSLQDRLGIIETQIDVDPRR